MSAKSHPSIVLFDYEFSPFSQKVNLLLAACGASYVRCDVPMVLPRPQLEALDIAYRRIPVLAIGKDVFCDSGLIVDALVELGVTKGVESDKGDTAYRVWGDNTFQNALSMVPSQALTPAFVKDRETIFPILHRSDLGELRPSALGGFRSTMRTVEDEFLGGGQPYIAGAKLGVADVNVAFVVRWVLLSLGIAQEPGFGKDDFPRTWKWIESLPKSTAEFVEPEEAKKIILGAEYALPDCKTSDNDALKDLVGKPVTVESSDADPGAHLQPGKLLGCDDQRVVLGLDNGVRLSFPRIGYVVKAVKA